jgi:Zn-dependent protease with chaperone function
MRVMGVHAPCEVFQIQGETNASVLSKPDRVVLSIEGPFFDIFTEDEMRGVFAHEFAHHLAHGAASPGGPWCSTAGPWPGGRAIPPFS